MLLMKIRSCFGKHKQVMVEKAEAIARENEKDMRVIAAIEAYQREHPNVDVVYKGERFH